MNENGGYEAGRLFVEAMKVAPAEVLSGFSDAMAEMAERPDPDEVKAALRKAEERGAARERERLLSAISDIVPNLQWLEAESQRHYISGKAVRPQVVVMMERLRYARHHLDARGVEFDPATMEIVKRVPASPQEANKVCEAFSDAYVTIFDGVVIEKIPVSVFVVEAAR
ncbi:MAG: hypothetical protein J5674_00160 [Candidatus Methanomethylophilaceae archaeon]|nr:hypothetical protein [Candidatus Methanomethylophilaceae archaeon]